MVGVGGGGGGGGRRAPISTTFALLLNCLIIFIAESSRGLILPTLNAYCAFISGTDKGAGGSVYAVSFFSAGRFVAAPMLGYLADYLPYRTLFCACAFLSIFGHTLYVCASAFPKGDEAFTVLIFSRFILGVSSGTIGPCRAVVTVLTDKNARTPAFSLLSTAKFFGYAIMPFAGSYALKPVHLQGGVVVDHLTMPGIIMVVANVALFFLLLLFFDERITSSFELPLGTTARAGSLNTAPMKAEDKGEGAVEGAGANAIDVATGKVEGAGSGSVAVVGTGSCAATIAANDATSDEAVLVGVSLFLFLNVLSKGIITQCEVFLAYLYQQVVTGPHHEDKAGQWLGFLGLLGLIIFAYLTIRKKSWVPSELSLLALAFLATGIGTYCLSIVEESRHVSFSAPLLTAGAVLTWSIGAPINDVLVTSLFSVDVNGKAAGKWLGLLTMSGSVGRIVLPLGITALGLHSALLASTVGCFVAILTLMAYVHGPSLKTITRFLSLMCSSCQRTRGNERELFDTDALSSLDLSELAPLTARPFSPTRHTSTALVLLSDI